MKEDSLKKMEHLLLEENAIYSKRTSKSTFDFLHSFYTEKYVFYITIRENTFFDEATVEIVDKNTDYHTIFSERYTNYFTVNRIKKLIKKADEIILDKILSESHNSCSNHCQN